MGTGENFLEVNGPPTSLRFVRHELEQLVMANSSKRTVSEQGTKIQPQPGFCIKSYEIHSKEKFFFNVCTSPEIPKPEDITEEELSVVLGTHNPETYRVPMSISSPHWARDNSKKLVQVCDIAIHPEFFAKVKKSEYFKQFFYALIVESINEKYNVQIDPYKWHILTNRKCMGEIMTHYIKNIEVQNVLESYKSPTEEQKQKLKQLSVKGGSKKPLIQEISSTDSQAVNNDPNQNNVAIFLIVKDDNSSEVRAEYYLPNCNSAKDIIVDIGEDRFLIDAANNVYHYDTYIGYYVENDKAAAVFNLANRMLTVTVPVKPNQ